MERSGLGWLVRGDHPDGVPPGRAKGFWNRDGGFEFPLSLLAGVVALLGTGPGSASLDAALGLSYPAALRGLLIAVRSSAPSLRWRFLAFGQRNAKRAAGPR